MWVAVLAALVALVPAGCSDGASRAVAPTEFEGSVEAFYDPPGSLRDSQPGDLIRYQRVDEALPATVWRVMYASESVAGSPIAVTGLVAVPRELRGSEEAPPVLSWAHGTTGIADTCAPSREGLGATRGVVEGLLSNGWIITATDYEGLGTPGRHPYLVGLSEGRGVLDIVRAVDELPGTPPPGRVAVWGHSQGGHAALFAGELAESWAPDLDLVGVVAGAPVSEMPLLFDALRSSPAVGLGAMAAAGFEAAYPHLDVSEVLTDDAVEVLPVVDRGCVGEVMSAFAGLRGNVFEPAPLQSAGWEEAVRASDPGHVESEAPVLVIHGEEDELVPPVASALLFDRLCRTGTPAERRTYAGAGHGDVVAIALDEVESWIEDRLAGAAAEGECPEREER